jgi:hypothetical protein
MAKSIARLWKVVVNNVVLSTWAFGVEGVDEKPKVDVSGFGGTKEYLPGSRDQSVTVSFLQDRAVGGPYATLKPLYEGGSSFPFYVIPDSTLSTSATNPLFGGTASMYSFPFGAQLDEREEMEIEFSPSTSSGFAWGTVAP